MHIIPDETRYQCHIKALHILVSTFCMLLDMRKVCTFGVLHSLQVVTGKTKKHAGIIDTNEFVTLRFRRKGNAVEALSVYSAWLLSLVYSILWPVVTSLLKTES